MSPSVTLLNIRFLKTFGFDSEKPSLSLGFATLLKIVYRLKKIIPQFPKKNDF